MQQELYIKGMTCQNCRKGVMEKMSALSGVFAVEVSLETGKALIETENQIPLDKIREQLGTKYTVTTAPLELQAPATQDSKLNALFPLFLIFGYLVVATFYLNFLVGGNLNDTLRHFMGLFFIMSFIIDIQRAATIGDGPIIDHCDAFRCHLLPDFA